MTTNGEVTRGIPNVKATWRGMITIVMLSMLWFAVPAIAEAVCSCEAKNESGGTCSCDTSKCATGQTCSCQDTSGANPPICQCVSSNAEAPHGAPKAKHAGENKK
jgi:hypothetical protein